MSDIIVIPTYNERSNIKLIIPEIIDKYPDISILVVDDNSPDNTGEEVSSLCKKYPNLRLLTRQKKTGLGDAYKHAFSLLLKEEKFRSIITMDADGSHGVEYISAFLENIMQYDLIIGSRYIKNGGVQNWEKWRKYLSKFGNYYAKLLTGLQINDLTAGFMCIRTSILKNVDFKNISSVGYSFQIDLKYNLIKVFNAKAIELPIIFYSRRNGESKLSNQIITEGIIAPLKLFLKRLFPRQNVKM